MKIREAVACDLEEILRMGQEFYSTYMDLEKVNINLDDCSNMFQYIIDHPEQGLILVIDRGSGKLGGMIVFIITPFMFNHSKRVASELCWWIDKDIRGGGSGIRMLHKAEKILKQKTNLIQMMSTERNDVTSLYNRLGYRAFERVFVKEWQVQPQ